jgi:hypothetical protein
MKQAFGQHLRAAAGALVLLAVLCILVTLLMVALMRTDRGWQPAPAAAQTGQLATPADRVRQLQSITHTRYLPMIIRSEPEVLAPTIVSVFALPGNIPATVTERASVFATVLDQNNNPVPGVSVFFNTTLGRFANGGASFVTTTDASGIATADLYAAPQLGTAAVTAGVFTQDGTLTSNTSVQFVIDTCNDTDDNVNPNNLPRDGLPQPSSVCVGDLDREVPSPDQEIVGDFYTTFLDPGQTITVDMTGIPPGADYDLYLFRLSSLAENPPWVDTSLNLGQDSEQVQYFHGGEREKYYLRVVRISPATSGPNEYTLTWRLSPLEAPGTTSAREGLQPATPAELEELEQLEALDPPLARP